MTDLQRNYLLIRTVWNKLHGFDIINLLQRKVIGPAGKEVTIKSKKALSNRIFFCKYIFFLLKSSCAPYKVLINYESKSLIEKNPFFLQMQTTFYRKLELREDLVLHRGRVQAFH